MTSQYENNIHLNTVANELNNMGFSTSIVNGSVIVKLQRRKVYSSEVELALTQVFDEIYFTIIQGIDFVRVIP